MIAHDFDYYLPDTWQEAVDTFHSIQQEGKTPLYYGGGTEIISMARVGRIRPDAVIDIKKIPECNGMGLDNGRLFFGAALTLNAIRENGLYPLLGLAGGRVADHTIQCRLTLGGNLAGTIHYHETLLPLLLADGALRIAGPDGLREVSADTLNMGNRPAPGELIVGASLEARYAALPYAHIKKTKAEKIGYPLVSVAALCADGTLRLAASALCSFPLRLGDVSTDDARPAADIAKGLAQSLPAPVLEDIEGSAGYRQYIFEKTVEKIVAEFRRNGGKDDA
jgi:CO/xanthine dehydrogenase FAD-binding subunit